MKRVLLVVFSVLQVCLLLAAGGDTLMSLKMNPNLYYTSKKYQPQANNLKYLIAEGTYVVTTDTLPLPFIDDFSYNLTPGYQYYQTHTVDSFFNVIGGCLENEGVTVVSGLFNTTPSWSYYWDTTHQVVDSTANPPIAFQSFGNSPLGCLTGTPVTTLYWPPYYNYLFDSASGFVLDSVPVSIDTVTLTYAPVVYISQSEPGTLWFDNYAYINNTYPINPPTIGVATLDGLNQYGLPYDNSSTSTYGQADYLTSKPINLGGLSQSDSVYLSFFFEPQGLGDYPDVADSLILEFRDNGGNWDMVWADSGYNDPSVVPDTFQQILIPVTTLAPPLTFFYNTFQFRFRNLASLYGNNNHWHIDYVKLDKNRSPTDTAIHDIAFTYPFPTILQNFTQEPALFFNPSTDLTSSISLQVRNLDPDAYSNPPATTFFDAAYEVYPLPATVRNPMRSTFNAGPYYDIQLNPASTYNINTSTDWPTDSLVINCSAVLDSSDSRPQNDTVKHTQSFTSVMAYDDGSAEKAYGLTGVGLKKFGYEFILPKPDTLAAFQVMFAQVEGDVSDLIFNFDLWDTLQMNNVDYVDTPIYTLVNQAPYYIDSTNGFTTYVLDSPIIVSGRIFFGWAQTDERRLQVGFDMNSPLGRKHMYIYTNGIWDTSSLPDTGSPMMRLIFSSKWWGSNSIPSGIKDLRKNTDNLDLFPNPSSGLVNISSNFQTSGYRVQVLNALGQQVDYFPSVNNYFDISNLANGVYVIILQDGQTGNIYRKRVVKTSG